MEHYRTCSRRRRPVPGWPRMPKEILAARPLLERLAREVPAKLGSKPTLLVWGMKDFAFRPGPTLPRMRTAFPDHVLVELPTPTTSSRRMHPGQIAEAIINRSADVLEPRLPADGYANASTGGHEHTRLRSP